jgi:hypothetical protein
MVILFLDLVLKCQSSLAYTVYKSCTATDTFDLPELVSCALQLLWQVIILAVVSATLNQVHAVKGRIPARTVG